MKHRANPRFWRSYELLPEGVQRLADKSYQLLKHDPQHPSLHFKKVGRFWSARVGLTHRVLGVEDEGEVIWFWIGRHDEYERLIGASR